MAQTNDLKFLENTGFLTINSTGGTANGKVLLRLTDISLSIENNQIETATFDNPFTPIYFSANQTWTISCSGAISTDTGEGEIANNTWSGDTRIVNTMNGYDAIELVRSRPSNCQIALKVGATKYYTGKVAVVSGELSATTGEVMTFSLELQGSGSLSLATS